MAMHFSLLAGESHRQGSLVGYSPWGRKESDTTERLTHIPGAYIPVAKHDKELNTRVCDLMSDYIHTRGK